MNRWTQSEERKREEVQVFPIVSSAYARRPITNFDSRLPVDGGQRRNDSCGADRPSPAQERVHEPQQHKVASTCRRASGVELPGISDMRLQVLASSWSGTSTAADGDARQVNAGSTPRS